MKNFKFTFSVILLSSLFLLGCGQGEILRSAQNDNLEARNEIEKEKTFEWKMAMTWPANLPGIGTGATELAKNIEEMSGGRMKIKVYSAGELFPALELFDQVKNGTVEMGHSAAYYWAGKVPAAQFFTTVPFGMNAQQMNAWIYYGGGLELWQQIYSQYGLVPFAAGNTGVQMGGWFNKEINSVEDLKGLKMRMPGLGGAVLTKLGASAENIPAGDIYSALEKGTIDATEWVGPLNDEVMGFPEVAKYYYYPGWHEPGSVLELIINQEAWESLPSDLQAIIKAAAAEANIKMLSEFEAKNAQALEKIKENEKVELKEFPADVLKALRQAADEVLAEQAEKDETFAKVYEAFKAFEEKIDIWDEVSEEAYRNL